MKSLIVAMLLVLPVPLLAAPIMPHNYTPKPTVEKVRYCTTTCYPTYGGGQRCITQCY